MAQTIPERVFLGALKRKCWLPSKPILETSALMGGPEITVFDFDLGNETVELVRKKVAVELGTCEVVMTETGTEGEEGARRERRT